MKKMTRIITMEINFLKFGITMEIFILLFITPLSLCGQEITQQIISLDTMIVCFYTNQKQVEPNNFLNQYDIFIGHESGDGILIKSPLNDLPENNPVRNCHAEWEISYSDMTSPCLRLKRILPIGISKAKAKEYEQYLAELFGRKSDGICATWFTGELLIYYCPQSLFGNYVSGAKATLKLKDGIIQSQQSACTKVGTMANYLKKKPQQQQIGNSSIYISVAGYNDGCWIIGSDQSAGALSYFVNDHLDVNKYSEFQGEFLFLMYTDTTGISSIHLLQPIKPDVMEQEIIADLKEQIKKLPKWSFGWLETLKGDIFPGCYLKAKYSSEYGWIFKDYLCKNAEWNPL